MIRAHVLAAALLTLLAPPVCAREPRPAFPARLDSPAATRAAARFAHVLADPLVAERLDVPPDELRAAREACAAAARGPLPADARADAVACAVWLGAPAASFLDDAAPAVRATAVAFLGAARGEPARQALAGLAADPDAGVAAAALGALCADDAARTLRELDGDALARLRTLAADRSIDRGHAAQLAICAGGRPSGARKPR